MKISESDRIKLLIDALKGFQSGLLTNATWAIGITAVAGGWLMTSNEAFSHTLEIIEMFPVFLLF